MGSAAEPAVLYSIARIRQNYNHLAKLDWPQQHTLLFRLAHNACPDLIAAICDMLSEFGSSGPAIQFELSLPHHFDVLRAVLPETLWSECVVDGTSQMPQSKLEFAVDAGMTFKLYDTIDLLNLR